MPLALKGRAIPRICAVYFEQQPREFYRIVTDHVILIDKIASNDPKIGTRPTPGASLHNPRRPVHQ